MNPIIRFCSLLALLLAACTPPVATSTAGPATVAPTAGIRLNLTSSSAEIQQAMLTSALRWQTIYLDGTVTWFDPSGQPGQTFRQEAWIDPVTSRFRVLLGSPGAPDVQTFLSSDGLTVYQINLGESLVFTRELPESARVGQFAPPLEPGAVHLQPLQSQIAAPMSEMVFPSDRAQNTGTFTPIAIETIAGRDCLVVEWTYIEHRLPSFRAWLDVETAVMLKLQDYDKTGNGILENERVVTAVKYNEVFDAALFAPPNQPAQFGQPASAAATPIATVAGSSAAPVVGGEVYFFTLPHQPGQAVQLVRLPDFCILGAQQCPALETIAAPFPFNFNLSALAWSPDGSRAAFAYPDNASGTPYKLWLFEPATKAWSALAQFAFIDPPFWSPDGTWLAFRVQDGVGGEEVYVVHPNGTDLRSLSASGALPPEGRPYVMDGWLTENVIMRSARPGNEGTIYLVRASDGHVRPLFETMLTKAVFVPAPTGAWLAYDDYDYASQKHALRVIEPDGAHPVDVAAFSGGSLYPIVWSPDGSRLAFAHSTSQANGDPAADVYVTGLDGSGMMQVYRGITVGRLVFSPDGKMILVEETTSISGGHLYAIDLETLEAGLIEAPGLSLDTDWYAPSWRP